MRRLAALVVVCLAGCGGGSSTRTAPIVEHGDGIRWVLPSGWHAATRSLTPHLANPREVLTAGTGRLASSPQRCAQFPSGALAAMRPTDVLVTVQERYGSTASFPGRPKHFTLGPAPGVEADACAGPHPAFVGHWWEFGEGGRGFHVLVA